MRLLKLFLAALLVVVSLAAGLLVAVTTAVLFLVGRLFPAARRRRAASPNVSRGRPAARDQGDVIEISATEVPSPRE